MSKLLTDLNVICRSQYTSSRAIDVTVELAGKTYCLVGTPTGAVDPGAPWLEFLRSDSTAVRHFVADDAESRFLEASRGLVDNGTQFYTYLRVSWELRVYIWELNRTRSFQ